MRNIRVLYLTKKELQSLKEVDSTENAPVGVKYDLNYDDRLTAPNWVVSVRYEGEVKWVLPYTPTQDVERLFWNFIEVNKGLGLFDMGHSYYYLYFENPDNEERFRKGMLNLTLPDGSVSYSGMLFGFSKTIENAIHADKIFPLCN